MPSKTRALVVVSNDEFRLRLVSMLVRGGLPADAVEGSAAAAALFGINNYTTVILEVTPADAAGPRLLSDITFRPDPPKLLLLAPAEPGDFRKRLEAFSPDLVLTADFDDATASALAQACLSGTATPSAASKAASVSVVAPAPAQPIPAGTFMADPIGSTPATAGAEAVIVVRMASEQRGNEVAELLRGEGHAVRHTRSTDELYALLNHDRIDLLVIEERLSGFLSGLDVVEMLQRELLRPDVILLSDVQAAQAARIKALMPSRIVSPSASVAAIAESACALLQQRKALVSFVPPTARKVVADHSDLRPLPQLLVKLTGYLSSDATEIPIRSLAHDIQSDPRATAELLRFTNSSSNGLRRRVNSVGEAVTLLGPRRTIVLILSQCATATSTDLIAGWAEPLRTWFFRRSVLTAGVAQAFAKLEDVSPDTAFLLGLIQDIGIAVIANAAGERYTRSVERVQHVPQLLLHNVERSEFGHTHADVSAALLQKWEMPASLVDPVLAHHGGNVPLSKVGQGFVRVMRIGEAIADLADCQCPQRRNVLNDLLSRYSADKQRRCTEAMAEGVAKAVEATALLRLPVPKPQSMLLLADELQAVHEGELVAIA